MAVSVLITECLQRDFIGPVGAHDPLPNKLHIGREESLRLMGREPQLGSLGSLDGFGLDGPSRHGRERDPVPANDAQSDAVVGRGHDPRPHGLATAHRPHDATVLEAAPGRHRVGTDDRVLDRLTGQGRPTVLGADALDCGYRRRAGRLEQLAQQRPRPQHFAGLQMRRQADTSARDTTLHLTGKLREFRQRRPVAPQTFDRGARRPEPSLGQRRADRRQPSATRIVDDRLPRELSGVC